MSQLVSVLGMRLDDALALCRQQGTAEPAIVCTHAPRKERREGTLRVIRVREGEWTVSAFMDETPKE
ncbi:MAG: hypothetical protein J6K13_10055 [Clostridia bacterium]|nr:hypothetical protein [Clostridia bacterium]